MALIHHTSSGIYMTHMGHPPEHCLYIPTSQLHMKNMSLTRFGGYNLMSCCVFPNLQSLINPPTLLWQWNLYLTHALPVRKGLPHAMYLRYSGTGTSDTKFLTCNTSMTASNPVPAWLLLLDGSLNSECMSCSGLGLPSNCLLFEATVWRWTLFTMTTLPLRRWEVKGTSSYQNQRSISLVRGISSILANITVSRLPTSLPLIHYSLPTIPMTPHPSSLSSGSHRTQNTI